MLKNIIIIQFSLRYFTCKIKILVGHSYHSFECMFMISYSFCHISFSFCLLCLIRCPAHSQLTILGNHGTLFCHCCIFTEATHVFSKDPEVILVSNDQFSNGGIGSVIMLNNSEPLLKTNKDNSRKITSKYTAISTVN